MPQSIASPSTGDAVRQRCWAGGVTRQTTYILPATARRLFSQLNPLRRSRKSLGWTRSSAPEWSLSDPSRTVCCFNQELWGHDPRANCGAENSLHLSRFDYAYMWERVLVHWFGSFWRATKSTVALTLVLTGPWLLVMMRSPLLLLGIIE